MALTQRQTQELQAVIEQRRAALIAELQDDVERVRRDRFEEVAGPARDAGDESVAALIADLDHADVRRDLTELRALEAARDRLGEGNYGVCTSCGGDIGFERLRASPGAVRCITCQTQYEKTYGAGVGSSL